MCYVQPTYPTDLKFSEWQRIEPLLPKPEARGGRTGRPRRWSLCLILNTIFHITRSGMPDGTGGKQVLQRLFECLKGVSYNRHCRLSTIWADGAYEDIVGWVKLMLGWTLEIVRRPSDAQGWMVLPKRWIVERTFGWLGRYRRLSREFEHTVQSSGPWSTLPAFGACSNWLPIDF